MRHTLCLLLACAFPCLVSCGSKPAATGEAAAPTGKTAAVAALKTDSAPAPVKPQVAILGAWARQKGDKGLPWSTLFPSLKADKGMTVEFVKPDDALFYVESPEDADAKFTLNEDGVLELRVVVFVKDSEKLPPPRTLKAQVTVTADELTLTDDQGHMDRFKRTKSKQPQFVLKPRAMPPAGDLKDRLVGQWEEVKDDDKKRLPWEKVLYQFDKKHGVGLELAKDGKLTVKAPIDMGFAPEAKYRLTADGTLEMILSIITIGKPAPVETVALKLKPKLTADELVLTDEQGNVARFKPVEWKWEMP